MLRKINIHLALEDGAIDFFSGINKNICNITESLIIFNKTLKIFPHLTLVMGEVDTSKYSIYDIYLLLEKELRESEPFRCSTKNYLLEPIGEKYIMCEIDGEKRLANLIQLILYLTQDYFSSINEKTRQTSPHITLAYISKNQNMVRKYLSTINHNYHFYCKVLEISDVGIKGMCVDSLFKINLMK